MAGKAVIVKLTEAELKTLRRWEKMPSLEYRLVQRAKIILAANTGETNTSIAEDLNVRRATASKWRCRYARQGIEGLYDFPRNGRRATYSRKDEKRVLSTLDRPVPEGEMIWTAKLISRQLENVSVDYVWRVFRKHGIHLQRRRSWCVSTDPQFAEKSADIVGLYISPPESAIVLSVDEKPCIQALERAQGYLRLPDGSTVTGFSDRYRRHGTTTLFAALEVATGLIKTGHYKRRRRREFLDFMNDIVKSYPEDKEIHVILDNLNTHKPKNEKWPLSHENVYFHFTPTNASWLNMVEIWFSILTGKVIRNGSFTSPAQVRKAIDKFLKAYNENAQPFEWRKKKVEQRTLVNTYGELCH